ncbi:MAG: hypothetical protein JWP81_5356 [Ferruginibacter sp.]|nr:hypothetical protein [Ferruginibacter sp.]
MKKLIVLFIAAIFINAASAQGYNDRGRMNERQETWNTRSTVTRYENTHSNDHEYDKKDRRADDYRRQAETDRANREYDQRINQYRNDRSINAYERERRINDMQRERQQKVNSFGKGLVVGAIAGVLLGVLASN